MKISSWNVFRHVSRATVVDNSRDFNQIIHRKKPDILRFDNDAHFYPNKKRVSCWNWKQNFWGEQVKYELYRLFSNRQAKYNSSRLTDRQSFQSRLLWLIRYPSNRRNSSNEHSRFDRISQLRDSDARDCSTPGFSKRMHEDFLLLASYLARFNTFTLQKVSKPRFYDRKRFLKSHVAHLWALKFV